MVYKWCLVPHCTNTSIKTKEKMFVSVPKNTKIRKKWFMLARRSPKDVGANTSVFMCEDHFNMEEDMANYRKYKMGFSKVIAMVQGALPSKFDCQADRKKRLNATLSRTAYTKRLKRYLEIDTLTAADKLGASTQQDDNSISQIAVENIELLSRCGKAISTDPIVVVEKQFEAVLISDSDSNVTDIKIEIKSEPNDFNDNDEEIVTDTQLMATVLQIKEEQFNDEINLSTCNQDDISKLVIKSEPNDCSDNDEEIVTGTQLMEKALQIKEEQFNDEINLSSCNQDDVLKIVIKSEDDVLDIKDECDTSFEVEPYICDYTDCDGEFNKKIDTPHIRNHTNEKTYKCGYKDCQSSFAFKCHLTRHQTLHSGHKPYKCNFDNCNLAFTQKFTLKTHKRLHSRENLHRCDFNDCTMKINLDNHKIIHTGGKPYQCNFQDCEVAFSRKSSLTEHKRKHTKIKPFKCDFKDCNKEFSGKSNFNKHKKIHSGEKPYKCNFSYCNSAFNHRSNLSRHLREHSGEKPYKCDFKNCRWAFSRLASLSNHKKSHGGGKPFKCDYKDCNLAFSVKSYLTAHIKLHTSENLCDHKDSASEASKNKKTYYAKKLYKCNFNNCDLAFSAKSNLDQHRRIHVDLTI